MGQSLSTRTTLDTLVPSELHLRSAVKRGRAVDAHPGSVRRLARRVTEVRGARRAKMLGA